MPQPPETRSAAEPPVIIRPLLEPDLPEADRVMRLAFGTFFGFPEPLVFLGDANCVITRWRADPTRTFAAECQGRVIGSVVVVNWGSVGYFGPLSVHPEFWDRHVGTRLMEPVIDLFERWQTKVAGLYTFAQSQKHVGLYQKFGFWPRFLTFVMARPITHTKRPGASTCFSEFDPHERESGLAACLDLTNAVYPGLDVRAEVRAVFEQNLGDTVLLWHGSRLDGLAVCHCGPGSEAGSGTCYVKFAAVRPGPAAGAQFDALLDGCEALGAARGATRIVAGINTARHEAYGQMRARGFRSEKQGVAMHRPNEPGYNRPGVYLIDDWR